MGTSPEANRSRLLEHPDDARRSAAQARDESPREQLGPSPTSTLRIVVVARVSLTPNAGHVTNWTPTCSDVKLRMALACDHILGWCGPLPTRGPEGSADGASVDCAIRTEQVGMTRRPENLANYGKPPIDEVAIAFQFPEIVGSSNERLRDFWKTVREQYPFIESRPHFQIPLESARPLEPNAVQLQLVSAPPQNVRLWLISETDDFLIQIQNSTFVQNWRRRNTEYPHFEEVRDLFWANFRRFRDFLTKAGLQQPRTQQVEVTYINWVSNLSVAQFLRPASATAISVSGTVLESELQTWSARYLIPSDVQVVERLYAQVSPAARIQDPAQQGTQFSLVVRAANAEGIDDLDADQLIADARVIIVDAFTSLTTPNAHDVWERLK